MRTRAAAVVVLTCTALTAGCGSKTPDYQSIWTTSGTATTATTTEAPIPIGQYLKDQGIVGEQVAPNSLTDLTVSIPTPPGWSKRKNPKLPADTQVIGKGDKYPRAILTVFKVNGAFDAGELVKHGLADAELAPNFHKLDYSTADFHGFPSGMIQGSHDLDGQRVQSWFRMVIATGSPPDNQRYLVQLSIITPADQAAAQAADVETIINGFTVAAK
ncbi:MAG: LpqN/LpqT family lipoprotein [Mycobacterium sp.]